MFFTGGLATMRMPGMTEKIEIKASEFGYSLAKPGSNWSPRRGYGLRATLL